MNLIVSRVSSLLWPNHRFEGTAEKLRFSAPVGLAAGRPFKLDLRPHHFFRCIHEAYRTQNHFP